MKKILIFFLALFVVGASLNDARQANKAYEVGNYDKAVKLYKKAIKENPENAKLYFNIGNALAKAGDMEAAIRYFHQYKQMVNNSAKKAKADYNIANSYFNLKKWNKSVKYYKQAMRQEAADIDAKYNYEMAKRKVEQQKKQDK